MQIIRKAEVGQLKRFSPYKNFYLVGLENRKIAEISKRHG